MKYLHGNIKHLLNSGIICDKDAAKDTRNKALRAFSKRIPCWDLLQITALEKFAPR